MISPNLSTIVYHKSRKFQFMFIKLQSRMRIVIHFSYRTGPANSRDAMSCVLPRSFVFRVFDSCVVYFITGQAYNSVFRNSNSRLVQRVACIWQHTHVGRNCCRGGVGVTVLGSAVQC